MKRLLGGILMAVGILLAGASGLCSGLFFVTAIIDAYHKENGLISNIYNILQSELFSYAILNFFFAIFPFCIGISLFLHGRIIRKTDLENRPSVF